MNCYEIKVRLSIQYEDGDHTCHYRDPMCKTWTVRTFVKATVCAWADGEERAVDLVNTLDFEKGEWNYDVTDHEIESISLCCTDDRVEDESIEIEHMEEPPTYD